MLNVETLPCKFCYKFLFIMLTLNDNSAITANENFQPIIKKPKIFKKKEDFLLFYRILILMNYNVLKIEYLNKLFIFGLNKHENFRIANILSQCK